MSAIDEGDGTLLDNSMVLFGSGMKDGNVHEPVDIPVALFGTGGARIRTGCRITTPQNSVLSDLHLTLLHAFEIEANDINGVADKTLDGRLA